MHDILTQDEGGDSETKKKDSEESGVAHPDNTGAGEAGGQDTAEETGAGARRLLIIIISHTIITPPPHTNH